MTVDVRNRPEAVWPEREKPQTVLNHIDITAPSKHMCQFGAEDARTCEYINAGPRNIGTGG